MGLLALVVVFAFVARGFARAAEPDTIKMQRYCARTGARAERQSRRRRARDARLARYPDWFGAAILFVLAGVIVAAFVGHFVAGAGG